MKMAEDTQRKLDQIDISTTARIDRRQTVFAQIEAALLSDKLSLVELSEENAGTDPYNTGRYPAHAWGKRAR